MAIGSYYSSFEKDIMLWAKYCHQLNMIPHDKFVIEFHHASSILRDGLIVIAAEQAGGNMQQGAKLLNMRRGTFVTIHNKITADRKEMICKMRDGISRLKWKI
jgi:hypothetical protein